MKNGVEIFPRALVTAARTFAKRPAVVGEVLCALVAPDVAGAAKLTDVERYIVEECRAEIAERTARRDRAAERKRRLRTKGGK